MLDDLKGALQTIFESLWGLLAFGFFQPHHGTGFSALPWPLRCRTGCVAPDHPMGGTPALLRPCCAVHYPAGRAPLAARSQSSTHIFKSCHSPPDKVPGAGFFAGKRFNGEHSGKDLGGVWRVYHFDLSWNAEVPT